MKHLWCWLTLGHIWERVGGVEPDQDVWNKMPEEQMYMCVACIKCVIINVKDTKRAA